MIILKPLVRTTIELCEGFLLSGGTSPQYRNQNGFGTRATHHCRPTVLTSLVKQEAITTFSMGTECI